MRVSAVQYHLQSISSFEQFANQVEHYIKTSLEYESDFILFPEFFTTQLLSIGDDHGRPLPIQELPRFTDGYLKLFTYLATKTRKHIIGGTHIIRKDEKLYNVAHLFHPDGKVSTQPKLHMTPTEIKEWKITPGENLEVFKTEKGTIAMLTCYDIEFPEIVRMAKSMGADIIFSLSCTDDRQAFYRVRYTSHARTIENQVYVVTTGTVGSLPTIDFMRSNYGQAAVITPNDIPFPPKGILVEGEINQEMIVTADLNLELLYQVREHGSVTTWRDRRLDLYPDLKPNKQPSILV
ncbi:acyltransferase [Mesobacillus campisalis]|uniref:Acyltransferase n=1 Tax=Mesobacillus campisalis TaxID=1408103 RepID=A0A0M2SVL1_9BACI|nr:carbon-nitrogen hydrolase family protein [Mesobacillus campisalis]KKK38203.1 acyltransferase [Mesobacillus campisalis]